MKIVILSGGSGKRLWPLSNEIRAKQFIKIFKDNKSMLQRTYDNLSKMFNKENIVIETSKMQESELKKQLGNDVDVSIEPVKRDTFPAVLLACLYLRDVKKVSLDENIIICPVDHYTDKKYFESIKKLDTIIESNKYNLNLMGITPKEANTKYGYIIPKDNNKVSEVLDFKEKPSLKEAKELIKKNALLNVGIFGFKLKYIIDKAHEIINFDDYYDLFSKYDNLEKISFDKAISENEKNIGVLKFNGLWEYLGNWDSLTKIMEEKVVGKGVISKSSKNVNIINETDLPIYSIGLKDVVISASPDGILVSNKEESESIKDYLLDKDNTSNQGEKSFGKFKVIDVDNKSQTFKVELLKGNKMSYHSHKNRDEVWIVISGTGKVIVDGMEEIVTVGDVITMQRETKHTIIAETDLKLIEVQLGEVDVNDKKKFDME